MTDEGDREEMARKKLDCKKKKKKTRDLNGRCQDTTSEDCET
jgi:hypothetical protein